MSKKLEIKQRRRQEAEEREAERKRAARRRNLITALIAAVVIAGVAVAVYLEQKPVGEIGGTAAEAGCEEIETAENPSGNAEHVNEGEDVDYETTPGSYGPHWPTESLADPGFYTEEVEEERLVHNMEHGQIVIFYDPDISEETEDKLQTLRDQQRAETIVVPFDGLEKPITLAAWGSLQGCDEPAQEVVDEFRTRFQGRGPEQIPGIDTFEG